MYVPGERSVGIALIVGYTIHGRGRDEFLERNRAEIRCQRQRCETGGVYSYGVGNGIRLKFKRKKCTFLVRLEMPGGMDGVDNKFRYIIVKRGRYYDSCGF